MRNTDILHLAEEFQVNVFDVVRFSNKSKHSLIDIMSKKPKSDTVISFLSFFARMPSTFEVEEIISLYAQTVRNRENVNDILEFHSPDVWKDLMHKKVNKVIKNCYFSNIINETPSFIFENGSQLLFSQLQGCTILLANTEIENYKPKISVISYDKSVILSKLNNYLNKESLLTVNQKYTTDNLGSYSEFDGRTNQIHMVARLRDEETRNPLFPEYLLLCIIRDYAMYLLSKEIKKEKDFDIETNAFCGFGEDISVFEYSYLASIVALMVAKRFEFDCLETANFINLQQSEYYDRIFDFEIESSIAEKLKHQAEYSEKNKGVCLFCERLDLARFVANKLISLIKELVNE